MSSLSKLLVALMFSTLLVATGGGGGASPANAACPAPGGKTTKIEITNVSKSYQPTGLKSNWVHPKHGPFTITYSRSATSAWTGTLTGTISTEAGVVFAKASASIAVSVAKTWSKTQTWNYSTTVPKDPKHQYQMYQRQETRRFRAEKFQWYGGECAYRKIKTGVGEMPRTSSVSLTWTTRRRAA